MLRSTPVEGTTLEMGGRRRSLGDAKRKQREVAPATTAQTTVTTRDVRGFHAIGASMLAADYDNAIV